jgi:hypothetical protein
MSIQDFVEQRQRFLKNYKEPAPQPQPQRAEVR